MSSPGTEPQRPNPIEWLLARRVITLAQVEECRRACGPPEDLSKVLNELVKRGHIDRVEVDALGSILSATGPCALGQPTDAGLAPTLSDGGAAARRDMPPPEGGGPGGPASPAQTLGGAPVRRLGHYEVLRELGRGGMGVVYEARDTKLARVVALKVLDGVTDPEDPRLVRFHREARTAARLKHPRVVQIHEIGEADGQSYIAMDLVTGKTLRGYMREQRADRLEEARILGEVAEALACAHEQGVVHRDVKPENILLDEAGHANVTDFGLAKELGTATRMTVSGVVLGTPSYMAPEQAEGKLSDVGPAADVYGVGAILYEMLTGHAPFEGPGVMEVLYQVLSTDVVPPSRLSPGVPRDLELICLKCLERDPSRRYGSATDLAEDLGRFVAGEPVHARPASVVGRYLRKAARHKAVLLSSAIALGVGAGFLLYVQVLRMRRESEVRSSLASGDRLLREGQFRDARDAFQRALAHERDQPEALAGLRRAEAALSWKEAAERNAREKAVAAEAEATEALRKAELVAQVLVRWGTQVPAVRQMEGTFYDSRLELEEKRTRSEAQWAHVQAFMQETPSDDTSQATMKAFAGWARRLAGHEEEGVAWMRQGAREDLDVPFGAFLEALVLTSQYVALQPLPAITHRAGGIDFGAAPPESRELQTIRADIERLLGSASSSRVWGKGLALDFQNAVDAIRAMQAGRYDEAEQCLTKALGSAGLSGFRTDLLRARARARYMLKRLEDGVSDLEAVAEVRPFQADVQNEISLLCIGSIAEAGPNADPRMLPKAEASLDRILEIFPGDPNARINRAMLRHMCGDQDRAISECDAALRVAPSNARAYTMRAICRLMKEDVEGAMADYTSALAIDPRLLVARHNLAALRLQKGDVKGAIEDCTEVLRIDPSFADALFVRANAHMQAWDFAHALADYQAALRAAPPTWRFRPAAEAGLHRAEGVLAQGELPAWVRKASDACAAVQRGDYEGARPLLEDVLREAGEGAEREDRFRPALAGIRYNLACVYSLLSAGQTSPGAAPSPVDPENAREMADRAFTHLQKALDLGFSDLPHLDSDPDLAPLRKDPRWRSLNRQGAK